jgi:stearoyl-CoA desaturase (Delta-9 desaturase)
MIRYVAQINLTWSINSFAHFHGLRPYDKNISPIDSKGVAIFTLGEGNCIYFNSSFLKFSSRTGWHNYHHVFPWDYSGSEFPGRAFNFSTAFIEFFAWLGWATELKTVSKTLIHKRVLRTGDGSHPYSKEMSINNNVADFHDDELMDNGHFWGFGNGRMFKNQTLYLIYFLHTGDKEMTKEDLNFIEVLKDFKKIAK